MLAAALIVFALLGGWAVAGAPGSPQGGNVQIAMAERPGVRPNSQPAPTQPAPFAAYLQSSVAEQQGDLATATSSLIRALADDPAQPLSLKRQAFTTSLLSGDVPTAIRLAHTLPAKEHDFLSSLVLTTEAIAKKRWPAAQRWLGKVVPEGANIPPLLWLAAHLQLAATPSPTLATTAQLAKRLQAAPLPTPLHPARNEHLARLWLQAGQPARAAVSLSSTQPVEALWPTMLALTLAPNASATVHMRTTFAAANPATAPLLPPVAESAPTAPQAHAAAALRDLALLLWQQENPLPAQQVFQLVLWLEPADSPMWPRYTYFLGVLEETAGNPTAALRLYQRAQNAPGATPELVLGAQIRAIEAAYATANQPSRRTLLKQAEQLADNHPDNPAVHHTLAALAQSEHAYALAYRTYARLRTLLPPEAPAALHEHLLFAQGAAAERVGNLAEAEQLFQQLLARNPAHAHALNYLGYMWVLQNKNLPEAYAMLRRALLLAPNDGAITDSVGWAYFAKGAYQTALTYLLRAAELEPDDPTIADHLGDTYAKLNDLTNARIHWQRALEALGEAREPEPGFTQRLRQKLEATE